MGGNIDRRVNREGRGPYVFRLSGQNYHRIGSLLPFEGARPKFAQLYIYDTENEVSHRIHAAGGDVNGPNEDRILLNDIIYSLIVMLNEHNPIARVFRMARERFTQESLRPVRLTLIGTRRTDGRQYNLPTASEVAAIIPGNGQRTDHRDIIVEEQGGHLKRINELHPSFMAMQYPLLFPYGEDGFRLNIPLNVPDGVSRKNVTMREYYAYRLMDRKQEGKTILKGGRLLQQFAVDAYAAIEENNLDYIREHQADLRTELYNGLRDHISNNDVDREFFGRQFILPSTFIGSPRYMVQNYQDAMAICRWAGPPDLFVTMTCNPNWPEIRRKCREIPGQPSSDRCDLIARNFKIKLRALMDDFKKGHVFGPLKAAIYTIEFQKRGLPHAHILLWLNNGHKIRSPTEIDDVISAELPLKEQDPLAYKCVVKHMVHGPCGALNENCACMVDNRCSKDYPKRFSSETLISKDGWPIYRRRDDGNTAQVGQHVIDNRWVIPHNVDLIVKYNCHINVEWCNQGMLIKYLFKYLNKGHDRATIVLGENVSTNDANELRSVMPNVDEIKQFLDCRYLSASEACWRIFGNETQYRSVGVERLSFHLKGENPIYFSDNQTAEDVLNRTTAAMSQFTEWFEANKKYPEAKSLTYAEFPTKFTWHTENKLREWRPRGGNKMVIGRIYYAPLASGERFYLRMLLNIVKGPNCYEDILNLNGVTYPNFKSVCAAMGLLDDDEEWHEAFHQASQWQLGYQLRQMFVTMLLFCEVTDHSRLWQKNLAYLSEDIPFMQRRRLNNHSLIFTDEEVAYYTLIEIEKILNRNNRSLKEFPSLPQLNHDLTSDLENRSIVEETRYNRTEENDIFEDLHSGLNDEQRIVYDSVLSAVAANSGRLFFVYGNGGTGKTYLWRTIIASLRSKGKIVLAVASSGIASLLLPGGRTAHSRFKIPININEESVCNVNHGTPLAKLMVRADLIIWDEAPLQHRYAFEAVNWMLQDMMQIVDPQAKDKVFGGKVVVLGGDFRQVLPFIERGGRQDIVNASINKSDDIWGHCHVFVLTINMRLRDTSLDQQSIDTMREFNDWLLDLGDGNLPRTKVDNEEEANWIQIPDDLLILSNVDPLMGIVNSTYPCLSENLGCSTYLREREILAPTNDSVDEINSYILDLLPGEMHVLLSADKICPTTGNIEEMQTMYAVEFLNSLSFPGIPNHQIKLKVGAPIILLRNISLDRGLCNGTRLIVKRIHTRVIEAEIISGSHVGDLAILNRIQMSPNESRWPFQFRRRQFPIKVCFAMTINKSQGQTFSKVAAYLPKPVFTHGQLYVVASRVTSRTGLKFYIDNGGKCPNNLTRNVVYKEVFDNLPSIRCTRSVN